MFSLIMKANLISKIALSESASYLGYAFYKLCVEANISSTVDCSQGLGNCEFLL